MNTVLGKFRCRPLSRRLLAIALSASSLLAGPAHADDYPNRVIKIVVAQGVGGGVDLLARQIAQKLTQAWGQSVIVENHPGANGIVGADYVAKSKPDGYTLLMAVPTVMTLNQVIYEHMPLNPLIDLTAVTQTTSISFALVVNADLPPKTVPELIAYAKSKPAGLNYGSGGIGNLNHLAAELFSINAGVKMQHVPDKGEGPAIVDLISGQTDLMFSTLPSAAPQIGSGKLRLLATLGTKRAAAFPNVPTLVESGLKNVVVEGWTGIVAPAHTPPAIINKIQQELAKDLQSPDLRKSIIDQGAVPVGSTPKAYEAFMQGEAKKWQGVAKAINLKASQ